MGGAVTLSKVRHNKYLYIERQPLCLSHQLAIALGGPRSAAMSRRRPAIPALLGSAAQAADTRHSGPRKLQKSSSRVREPIGGSAGAAAAGGFALPPGDEAADSSEATTESGEAGEAASAAAELKMATQSAALGLPLYRTAWRGRCGGGAR